MFVFVCVFVCMCVFVCVCAPAGGRCPANAQVPHSQYAWREASLAAGRRPVIYSLRWAPAFAWGRGTIRQLGPPAQQRLTV